MPSDSRSRASNAFSVDTASANAACAAFRGDADTGAEVVVEEAGPSPGPVAGAAHGAGGRCHPPDGGGGECGGGGGAAVASHLTTAIAGGCVCGGAAAAHCGRGSLFSGAFRWYRPCHGAGSATASSAFLRLSVYQSCNRPASYQTKATMFL